MSFEFELGQTVEVLLCGSGTGELGEVIGRAEYTTSLPAYFVRYRTGDRNTAERWWSQDALRPGGAWRRSDEEAELRRQQGEMRCAGR